MLLFELILFTKVYYICKLYYQNYCDMSIKDRLQMVIKMNNLSNASFADQIGVQRSSISHIMAGRNKPSLDFIQKTLESFPRVNAQWLITGKQSAVEESNMVINQDSEQVEEGFKPDGRNHRSLEVQPPEQKQIERVVVFFTDGTYAETLPSTTKKQ